MLFNSLEFFIFLPIVFGLYWLVPKKAGWQNAVLLAASIFFYGWWDWRVLGLFVLSIGATVAIGRMIEQLRATRLKSAKALTTVGVVILLLVLGFFKYYNFFVDSLAALLSTSTCHLNLVLPLGISFYTFMCVSYLVDTYTGKLSHSPPPPLLSTLSYLSFFPQIVAGPIGRAPDLLPQYSGRRVFNESLAIEACRQILWGAFTKYVVADNCCTIADTLLDCQMASGGMIALGSLAFTIQIYGDFAGYSNMAVGLGKLFGIRLKQNFAYPYFATSFSDFWRRWHISLTTWFRDYIYFPLGGSRCSLAKTLRNTWIVFLVSGLWHGADWTFVAWGGLHAFFLSFGVIKKRLDLAPMANRKLPGTIISVFFVDLCASFAWLLFRAPTFADFARYISSLAKWGGGGGFGREYRSPFMLRC